MDYFLKFIGTGFTRPIAIVQITETLMALAIPVFGLLKSDRGLTFHMESLCMLGLGSSLVSLLLASLVLVEFPRSSQDETSLRWIGKLNGKDLPQDLQI